MMPNLEIEDVLGAMNVKDVKVGMRVSLKSFTGKQVTGTVVQDQGSDNFFVELDDGSGENHHAAELTSTGAVAPKVSPQPAAGSGVLSSAEMKKQIVEGKAAMKSNPAQFKATLQMVFGLAGTSPMLVQSMVSAAAIDIGYVKDTIAVIKADPKMSKQWDAALKANPKEAAALQAALTKTEGGAPNFLTKKFLKVPVWGWGTGGAGALGLTAWLIWGRKRGR